MYSKKWFQLRLFRDDYFDPICIYSPCWQYAGNILGLILFLYLFWLYRDQVSSHGNLRGLQLLNFSFLLLFLPGSEGHARWCVLPFQSGERIWLVESIEKALVSVVSWFSTHLFSANQKPLYKCVLISCFRSLCFAKLLSPTEILLGHSQARQSVGSFGGRRIGSRTDCSKKKGIPFGELHSPKVALSWFHLGTKGGLSCLVLWPFKFPHLGPGYVSGKKSALVCPLIFFSSKLQLPGIAL